MSTDIKATDLGVRDYAEILDLQTSVFQERVDRRKKGESTGDDRILIVEHLPVLTLGLHARKSNILLPETELSRKGISVYSINRGGDVTYHGPGQIVAYPIIDLERRHYGVKEYVNRLEESVILTLRDFGIEGGRVEGATGVWLEIGTPRERKICAIGIKCSRFITMHGLALNVNTDMDGFSVINPCGFVDKGVTSMARETGKDLDMCLVKARLVAHLKEIL